MLKIRNPDDHEIISILCPPDKSTLKGLIKFLELRESRIRR